MVASKPIRRLAALLLFMVGFTNAACAQDKPDNWLTHLFQPPASSSVPTPGGGANDWSGQSGASGDPRMTADAIRAAAADFGNCLADLWPDAARRVARLNNRASNPPKTVMLVFRWSEIIPRSDGAYDRGPWGVNVFFRYDVQPEDLK